MSNSTTLSPAVAPIRAPSALEILAIGPWDRGEFAVARAQITDARSWNTVADCETASEMLDSDEVWPDVLLLAQPLPGTYQQDEVEQLRCAAPLAQIVAVAGTWCEGELRTGKPLVGVMRLYWYQLSPWWYATLENHTSWSPLLDGSFAGRIAESSFSHELGGIAVIHTPMCASYETLAEILKPQGMECVWARHESELPPQLAVGLWDGAQLDPPEFMRLQAFADTIRERQGAITVLLDFPRKEHFPLLQKIGCTAILGKPYVLNELVTTLLQITKPGDGAPRV